MIRAVVNGWVLMLVPFFEAQLDTALALLREGFPHRGDGFWRTALKRLFELSSTNATGVPAGYFLMDGSEAVGIILTPASVRRAPNGDMRRVVNLSSWYVRPGQRWRAAAMLRQVLNAADAIYTDLTPTAEVIRLLPAYGFAPLNTGLFIDPLPLVALRAEAGATIIDLADVPPGALPQDERALLSGHASMGCVIAALHDGHAWWPLAFKISQIKRVPVATLVYSGDNRRFNKHLGTIARFLLRRGCLALVRDARDGETKRRSTRYAKRGLKFAKSTPEDTWFFNHRTDFAGSELCVLDL